jgi:hypothetical protein
MLTACASPPRPPRLVDSDYPGQLQSPSVLRNDVLWQQHVSANWGEGERRGFDAAVQKQGDTLTVLVLSPIGPPALVATQRGGAIDFHNELGEDFPFPPRFLLLDVQRAFFPWLPETSAASAMDETGATGAPLADGERHGVVGEEQIAETIAAGRIVKRCFRRLDGKPAGAITIRYEWDRSDWLGPSRAVLENGWFGYRLVIDTVAETPLTPGEAAPAARR